MCREQLYCLFSNLAQTYRDIFAQEIHKIAAPSVLFDASLHQFSKSVMSVSKQAISKDKTGNTRFTSRGVKVM